MKKMKTQNWANKGVNGNPSGNSYAYALTELKYCLPDLAIQLFSLSIRLYVTC